MQSALIIIAAFAIGFLCSTVSFELFRRKLNRQPFFQDAAEEDLDEDEDDRKEREKREQRGFYD